MHYTLKCVGKILLFGVGGKGGIRTLDPASGIPLFESGAFNHSATFPYVFLGFFFANHRFYLLKAQGQVISDSSVSNTG